MKFKDVPIGDKFKYKMKGICIKTDKIRFIKLDYPTTVFAANMFFENGDDHEVELITKCSNCKYKFTHKNMLIKYMLTKEYIHRCIINDRDEIRQNIETFSCSLFEENENETIS